MNIKLDGTYTLKSTESCFHMAKHRISEKSGNKKVFRDYYYSDFPQALEGFARHRILDSTATTIEALQGDLRALYGELKAIREVFDQTVVKGKMRGEVGI